MPEHAHPAVERHCDVAVIGGSVAGLAAALHLGRQRRSVIVIDSGRPRIAAAAHAPGDPGREAIAPTGLIADAREEVRSHGGEVLSAIADGVTRDGDRLRVALIGGHVIVARRVLAATGLVDELPDTAAPAPHEQHGDAEAVIGGTRFRPRIEPFEALGLPAVAHPSGLGDVVEVDANGMTAVAGLYAAGTVTDPGHEVASAAAHGARIGAMIDADLAQADLRTAARWSGNEADWDHRYSGEPLWSGNPNGTLVAEAGTLSPGSALDVGAGEGGDAFWLAEQGWTVTASDVSQRVLDRIAAGAELRGLTVTCLHADANALDAFPRAAFDLVCAQYASIPRTPDQRGVRSMLDAVAPGGTLVVVGHDLEHLRRPLEIDHDSRPFDPDAFVRVDDVAAVLAGSPGWEIETHETRPRPPGAASASHHVDDIVLRARRSAPERATPISSRVGRPS